MHRQAFTATMQAKEVEVDSLRTRRGGQRAILAENLRTVAGGLPFPADDAQLSWGRFADAQP